MKAMVFVGPTLRPDELPQCPDLVLLPPVAQGDLYRAARQRPRAIGIIDGYFEGVLSVWHKEILWAMAEGIHVFGSASMGALRAAELHDFILALRNGYDTEVGGQGAKLSPETTTNANPVLGGYFQEVHRVLVHRLQRAHQGPPHSKSRSLEPVFLNRH